MCFIILLHWSIIGDIGKNIFFPSVEGKKRGGVRMK